MGLQSLALRDFRLFVDFSLRPDPDAVTVLLSANGTGKTSVLEAVYALATASSFRTASAADMIRNHQHVAEIHGVVMVDERRVQVDLTLTRGSHRVVKRMQVNGQHPKSRAELAEWLPVTIFTPEGVDMIRRGPEGRRDFFTTLLVDVDPRCADVIERFDRVLRQRNALLRRAQSTGLTSVVRDELAVWSNDFANVSNEVLIARRRLISQLGEHVSSGYRDLAAADDAVEMRYETSWHGDLTAALSAALPDDVQRGYTTIGPHRDDVLILLAGRDARRQASQGEQRSLALALRLAGHALVHQERSISPLLLLDDVFSELDPTRSERLLRLLPKGQTLVTTASPIPRSMEPAIVVQLERRAS